MDNRYNTLKNKKDFEKFISEIPQYIKDLAQTNKYEKLIFSEEEVKSISTYFIDLNNNNNFNSSEKLKFIAYLGEFLIHNFGGEWFFTGNRDAFTPNEAYIGKSNAIVLRECPIDSVYEILENKNPNYFYDKLIQNKEQKSEINDLFSKLFSKIKKK
ncbi:hypothetical protein [Flavobacterium frigoris]|uniref:DUF3806 domain-containing protein n=1 Tax=Flavobacterium frigoris TaxID=229204 RepID=A0A1H9S7E4_FLAFI|nr:hypothetical protein [Flavobacterium frigoris]SER80900.1 hypothetical protein SAMN05444355_1501 [Flavobacterium frigoris]